MDSISILSFIFCFYFLIYFFDLKIKHCDESTFDKEFYVKIRSFQFDIDWIKLII